MAKKYAAYLKIFFTSALHKRGILKYKINLNIHHKYNSNTHSKAHNN